MSGLDRIASVGMPTPAMDGLKLHLYAFGSDNDIDILFQPLADQRVTSSPPDNTQQSQPVFPLASANAIQREISWTAEVRQSPLSCKHVGKKA